MLSPDLPDDFFKLSLSDDSPVYPHNATAAEKRELDENCELVGKICSILQKSLKYGFETPKIAEHFFVAIHIYGNPTIVAYYPSRLVKEHVLIQNGVNSEEFFLLDCRTGLLGTLARRMDRDDRIVEDRDGRLIIKNVRDIPQRQLRMDPVPALILVKKELSEQYIVRKGAATKNTVVVIITQTDYPDRTVIKV